MYFCSFAIMILATQVSQELKGISHDEVTCALRGTVKDSVGGLVSGATLLLEPGNRFASSDKTGAFCYRDLEPGKYDLTASMQGFSDGHRDGIQISSGAPVQVEIVLGGLVREDSMVVTATRTQKLLEDVPIRTEVVGRDQIISSGARNLADAVEFTNGVRVESNCQNCNFSQIRLLGLEGAYTQILIDGQPTVSSLAQVYGIEQIPARMIERIEVVKGGGSAIYGAGAVGGVVNVISHTPSETGGFLDLHYESMQGRPGFSLNGAADWVSQDEKTWLTIFGQNDRMSHVDVDGDGFTEVTRRRLQSAGLRFSRKFFESSADLVFDFNVIDEDRRGGDRLDLPPDQANLAEEILTKRTSFGASWRQTLGGRFDYSLSSSLAYTDRDSYYGADMDPNAFGQSKNPLWIFDSQFNHYLDSQILSWGAQLTLDSIEDSQPGRDRFIDETYSDVGFFVQHDWFFAPGWELISGVRLDKHSEVGQLIASPRLALMWSPRQDFNIRLSAASGFRPPQVFDEDLHISLAGGEAQVIRLADDLREENSYNFMLGGEWSPTIGRATLLLEVNGFLTRMTDLHNVQESDDPDTPDVEFVRVNAGGAKVFGAEFNFGINFDNRFQFQAGVVEQRSRFDQPEADFGSRDFFRTPRRYGIASVDWSLTPKWDVFLGLKYTGRMVVPHYAGFIPEDRLETSPSFLTVDASLSRSFSYGRDRRIIFTLGGRNLTDDYQDDLDRGPLRDSDYVYGPRFPRSVYLSTQFEF